jgi:hypothetical protein
MLTLDPIVVRAYVGKGRSRAAELFAADARTYVDAAEARLDVLRAELAVKDEIIRTLKDYILGVNVQLGIEPISQARLEKYV